MSFNYFEDLRGGKMERRKNGKELKRTEKEKGGKSGEEIREKITDSRKNFWCWEGDGTRDEMVEGDNTRGLEEL